MNTPISGSTYRSALVGMLSVTIHLCACSSDHPFEAGGGDADAGTGTHGGAPNCRTTGFAPTPTDFALPNLDAKGHSPLRTLAGQGDITDTDAINFATVDLDGDGKLDLVLTSRTSDSRVGLSK